MGMFRIYIPKVTSLAPAFHQFFATEAKHEEQFCMGCHTVILHST